MSATTCPPLTPLAERLLFGAAGGESRDGKLRDPRSRFFAQRVVGERPVPRPFPRRCTQPVQAASRGSARSCGLHPACLGCPASALMPPPEQEVTPIANMNVRLRGESSGRDWHQVGWAAGESLGASEFPEMFLGLSEWRDEFPAHSSPGEHLTPAGVYEVHPSGSPHLRPGRAETCLGSLPVADAHVCIYSFLHCFVHSPRIPEASTCQAPSRDPKTQKSTKETKFPSIELRIGQGRRDLCKEK